MENKFWKNVDHTILEEASRRFGTSEMQMKKLIESTNLVYEYKRGDESLILRITHSSKTKIEYILGEFDSIFS